MASVAREKIISINWQLGDVVLTEPRGIMGKLVVWFQGLFGDPARYGHAGIITAVIDGRPQITEALRHVVTRDLFEAYEGCRFAVFSKRDLILGQRGVVAWVAKKYMGRSYGWWKLLIIALDAYISKKIGADVRPFSRFFFIDRYPICSYLVAMAYYIALRYRFGVDARVAQPDDLHDYFLAHASEWECIYEQ